MILGTEGRDLWKLAAHAYSSSPNQPMLERATIGALCGNSEPLLQISNSWEDRLWALLKGYLDVTLEEHIRSSTIGQSEDLPLSYWKQKQPIETLLQKASATMSEKSIHRKIQELLIENDFVNLAEFLETAEPNSKQEARFLAHMTIVLQQLSIENASSVPIHVYADKLASEADVEFNPRGDAMLVAAYAQAGFPRKFFSRLQFTLDYMRLYLENFPLKSYYSNFPRSKRLIVMPNF